MEGVAFHALDSRVDGVLWDVRPAYVIMYDSDIACVRQLEVTLLGLKGVGFALPWSQACCGMLLVPLRCEHAQPGQQMSTTRLLLGACHQSGRRY